MMQLPYSLKTLVEILEREKNHGEFVFVAGSERWRNLPNTGENAEISYISSSEINRRLKKYAKRAGVEEGKVNTRVLRNTRKILPEEDILEIIEREIRKRLPQPITWKRDPRLHGIGRRRR